MDSKDAIELIKSDVAHLVKTIQQQDKIIKTQINMLDVASGVLSEIRCRDCKIRDYCESVEGEDIPCREVWEKYLQSEVSK